MQPGDESEVRGTRNVLILTAHPDDECMFFAPTILSLSRDPKCQVFILCLSTGNFYKKGEIRQKEFKNSCAILGVNNSNVFIEDNSDLPDDPLVHWREETVADIVLAYTTKYKLDEVYTFDAGGVSGHTNHTALYSGVRYMLKHGKLGKGVTVYALETTNILRKYISMLDIPLSYYHSGPVFVASWSDIITGQKAMYAHWSQFQWFRVLYIAFSRYMTVNTYNKME